VLLIPESNVVPYLAFQFSAEVKIIYKSCQFHADYAFISTREEVQSLGVEGGVQKWETWWRLEWK
jgi:hypothetical protein